MRRQLMNIVCRLLKYKTVGSGELIEERPRQVYYAIV